MQPNSSDLVHLQWLKDAGIESFQGLRVLDLGCGSGYVSWFAAQQGAKSSAGIDVVAPRAASADWQFLQANLDGPDWSNEVPSDGGWDLILAFDIIEHLESPYRFLANCRDLLAESGRLIITTPNSLSWERWLRPNTWSGVTDPQHKVLFSKYTLGFLLSRLQLEPRQLSAPLRSLALLGPMQPQLGGQILCVAGKLS